MVDRVLACSAEVVSDIDAENITGPDLRREPERDRARATADVEHAEAIDQTRKQEVRIHRRTPRGQKTLEHTHRPAT
jgi:hypothetical protein